MIRETYASADPTDSAGVIIETDPHLAEVGVSMFAAFDQPDLEAALDASQVGAIVRQLTTWLAERAR
ncbi:hypothetical protein I5G58_gp097 [Mycobacterium phage BirdsNest]|uniref:Uncharacterized protein n=1 Tax=Mycobacterium phage BirdsNest TaxID=2686231 RepID=A0A6B9LJ98_9CAUD|nr:hypothetical protein I5G58_gp097 [Mycobacterium phage BirdsNest]QHB37399.1 hypothetical protein PBI_BIRDSNEST_97 [Mycobacterium phage BirdsNest]